MALSGPHRLQTSLSSGRMAALVGPLHTNTRCIATSSKAWICIAPADSASIYLTAKASSSTMQLPGIRCSPDSLPDTRAATHSSARRSHHYLEMFASSWHKSFTQMWMRMRSPIARQTVIALSDRIWDAGSFKVQIRTKTGLE